MVELWGDFGTVVTLLHLHTSSSSIGRADGKQRVRLTAVLTDVVGVLLHDVRLQQVIRQHEGPLLHGVQQHGGGPQLLACAQLPPRSLGLWLQQVVDRRHHGLQNPNHCFRWKKLSWAWNCVCVRWFDVSRGSSKCGLGDENTPSCGTGWGCCITLTLFFTSLPQIMLLDHQLVAALPESVTCTFIYVQELTMQIHQSHCLQD